MGVGRGYCGAGPCGEGRPLRHHDTMASPIRYGYWTKGQPGRGQHREPRPMLISAPGLVGCRWPIGPRANRILSTV